MTFGARARIRRSAIRHNLQLIKSKMPGARVMAVIKANAYGHGMLPIGRVLEDPPGEHPILLCYKLNDAWLTPKRG